MAKALKCDICGDYFEIDSRTNKKRRHNRIRFCYMDEDGDIHDFAFYDCCPRCLTSINGFIKDGGKTE